jgi:hypothetical protein
MLREKEGDFRHYKLHGLTIWVINFGVFGSFMPRRCRRICRCESGVATTRIRSSIPESVGRITSIIWSRSHSWRNCLWHKCQAPLTSSTFPAFSIRRERENKPEYVH